jgi:SAM-dependent methyltransferase
MAPELARVIETDGHGCTLVFIADARVQRVRLSADLVRHEIAVRPNHLVLVIDNEVVYRGPLEESVERDLDTVRERCIAEWQRPALREVSGDPRRIVATGYDRIAECYADWSRGEVVDEVRPKYLSLLLDSLPTGADVLELGCGAGLPTTRQLAERFTVTGMDISERQIELARRAVPGAKFVCDDMTRVVFSSGTFDAVASFYSFNHLPFGELAALLVRIAGWLRPSGLLVTAFASSYDPGTIQQDWLGAPMYFSGYAPADTRRFIEAAGLSIFSLQPRTDNRERATDCVLLAGGPQALVLALVEEVGCTAPFTQNRGNLRQHPAADAGSISGLKGASHVLRRQQEDRPHFL